MEELKPPRDMSRTPFFQAMFVLQQDEGGQATEVPGLSLTPYGLASAASKFDLTFFLAGMEGRLWGAIEYSTDLFDAGTIERMSGHFARLLEEAVAHPDKRVGELEMLAQAERPGDDDSAGADSAGGAVGRASPRGLQVPEETVLRRRGAARRVRESTRGGPAGEFV